MRSNGPPQIIFERYLRLLCEQEQPRIAKEFPQLNRWTTRRTAPAGSRATRTEQTDQGQGYHKANSVRMPGDYQDLDVLRWFGSDEAAPLFTWAGKILPPALILLLPISGHVRALPAALVAIWCSFFVALFVWGGERRTV